VLVALELIDAAGTGHPDVLSLLDEARRSPTVILHVAVIAARLNGESVERRLSAMPELSLVVQLRNLRASDR
jgi:hypothetical protein